MSMGYTAGYADVVDEKFVKQTCPKQFRAFMRRLDKEAVTTEVSLTSGVQQGLDLDTFAREAMYGENCGSDTLRKKYAELCDAFEKATGLTLSVDFHDREDGDRYDDVYGHYWAVGNVYKRTTAGKKWDRMITRAFFVNYG